MRRITWILAILGALALLAGCNTTQSVNGPTSLPADLENVVVNDVSTDPNAAGINAEDELVDEPGFAAAYGEASALDVLPDSARIRWWRKVTSSSFLFSRAGTEDSMYVSAQRTNTGLFNGALHRRAHRDSLLYNKPYSVTWGRKAIYKKIVGLDGEDDTQWMLSSVSLSHTTQNSPGLTPPTLLKVQLSSHDGQGNPVTVEFSDPDQMFDPNALPEFAVGDSIQVKVYTTGDDSNERGYIHFSLKSDDRGRALRRPLAYVAADGAFEGSFRVREGFRGHGKHLIRPRSAVWVDVLTKETIYDTDPGKYAATGWGLPFRLFRPLAPVALNQ